MPAFLYLGKMRINEVTSHQTSHHYDSLCILQAVSELCVHFVISLYRDTNDLLHVQAAPTFTGLSLLSQNPPSDALCGSCITSHDIPAPRVGTAVTSKHPQERWNQLKRVQRRGGEQAEKMWTSRSTWACSAAGLCWPEVHLQAHGWSASFVPRCEREIHRLERIFWDSQKDGAHATWGKAWEDWVY